MATETALIEPLSHAATQPRQSDRLVTAFFIASGAAGLIYQVVWSRELVLVFGNTTQAISTIVVAVMFGLGLGGFLGGWLARRAANPLRAYGILEVLVGLFALLLPLGFGGIAEVYRAIYNAASPTELTLVRFALAVAAVTPATLLMGMTLPVLTQHMIGSLHDAGARLAGLYAANTLGAFLGTLISGFVLIELLGLVTTSYVAVALNLGVGLGALWLARQSSAAPDSAEAVKPEEKGGDGSISARDRALVYVATFISGFIALSLEVLWTRMLAEGSGSRIYIFVLILAIYLFGIALGSTFYKRRSRPDRDTLTTLGFCFAGVGLAAIGTVILGSGVLGTSLGIPGYLILAPATVLMGYAFPLSGRLVTPTVADAGQSVGQLYAWNTAGSILGAFAAAFLLAATIGTNRSILVLAAASLLLAAVLAARDRASLRTGRRSPVPALVVAAVLTVAATVADLPLTQTLTQNHLRQTNAPTKHLEDALATVDSVGGPPGDRRLYVGGIGMTALTVDTKVMAYLPKALRPQAARLLVIAFGMGSTYRSGLILGMHTDAVELSPSVPSQMPTFYPDAQTYLHHPNGRIIVADGRNYVRLSTARYDLIAADPPPPIQSAGTVVLYTREFLEQGKARLNPGGIFMLWIPYDEPLADFRDHARTFRAVFPHTELVFGPSGRNGVYMLGSEAPLVFDPAAIAQTFGTPAAQADLAGAPDFAPTDGPGWANVIGRERWLSDAEVDAFTGPGPLITDDHPRTEYYVLRTVLAQDWQFISEARLRAASSVARP